MVWLVETVWGLLVPAAIFFSGVSARLRAVASGITRHWYGVVVIYGVLLTFVMGVVDLPLDYYADFVRPHEYGLSAQTLGKWWRDEFTGLGLALAGGALLIWIPFALVRRAPTRWWWYCWLASVPLSVGIAFVEPIWIEPLFNDVAPMRDTPLRARILDLAERAGIEGARVYEVDKSVDTNESNAYVTGIGSTTRIVLWDTIIQQSTPDELVATMGHEMGHFVLGHVWRGLLLASAGSLVLLRLIDWSARWILARDAVRTRARVSDIADVASLPLFVFLFGVFLLTARPPVLGLVRDQEHEADRFGLEITHDNAACATSFVRFVRFVQHDLSYPTPGPWYVFWRSTHPPMGERIDFCNEYHPWLEGSPERYSKYFTR